MTGRGGRGAAPAKSKSAEVAAAVRVVATAGHVDHGKSTLVTALTGIDPDRLREERERGMTIDLGFAHRGLPSGLEVGLVDVPGHQDFIRNMLAGVGSIDAVLLVVAADEGVMPQTREHVAILRLLGVERGVVVLSKRDLVDDEWAALVSDEVRAVLRGTPLEGAELVAVSAARRSGLDELVAALDRTLAEAPARVDVGRPRLPVDRAFTMAGFGTVVTGTLVDGSFAVGEEIAILPGDRRARIRSLQTHRRTIERAQPGSRVAMNLSGVEKSEIARGMVVARPGTLAPVSLLGLRIEMLPSASAPLEHDEEVKVHVGTAELMARASVLEGPEVAPGASGWVQLRLAEPVALAVGDRLVIRRPSPAETLGGGRVVDASRERLGRRAATIAALERRAAPSAEDRLLVALDAPRTAEEAGSRSGVEGAARDAALVALVERGAAVLLGDAYLSRDAFEQLATRVERALAMAHRRAPLRAGLSREELRASLGLGPRRFAALVERLSADGRVAERADSLALPDHSPALSAEQEQSWSRAREALAREPLRPPAAAELATSFGISGDLLAALAEHGDIVRIDDAVFLPDAVGSFGRAVVDELAHARTITVARARDLTGSSRKHVLPLLRFLDDHGLTRRVGDDRILIHDPEESRARLARAVAGEGRSRGGANTRLDLAPDESKVAR